MAPKSGEKKPAKKVVKKTGAGGTADKKKKASRKAVESYKIYIYKVGCLSVWCSVYVPAGGSATAGKPFPLAQHGRLAALCSSWPRAPQPLSAEIHLVDICAAVVLLVWLCQPAAYGMSSSWTSGLQLTR